MVCQRQESGKTVLHLAAESKSIEKVEFLCGDILIRPKANADHLASGAGLMADYYVLDDLIDLVLALLLPCLPFHFPGLCLLLSSSLPQLIASQNGSHSTGCS